jgi:hypothetical protein
VITPQVLEISQARTFELVIAKPIDLTNLVTVVENFERYMAWRSQSGADQA